jgi:hypothetical protein
MSRKTKRIILFIAALQLALIAGLLILPEIVTAIPGRYRVALEERSPFLSQIAEGLIDQVAPAAQALPAPVSAASADVVIPALAVGASVATTPEPTATVAATALPIQTPDTATEPSPTPTHTPSPTPSPTATPIPGAVKLEGIERIQQAFNNCGPANLTQVLNWYENPTTQEEAAAYLKPNPEDRNVSPWQLSDYVNEFTELRSTVHSGGTMEMVKRLVAAGYPVVIEKGYEPGTPGAQGWFGHYLTVFGYDDEQQIIYSMDTYLVVDPAGRTDSYEEIEHYWQHFNYTFYVVYRPEDEAEVFSLIDPELLDPMTMWQTTAERAQAEVAADDQDAFGWFNLGTSLTRLGELTGESEYYANGAAAFDKARTIGLPPRLMWYEFRPYVAYMKVGRIDDMIAITDTVLAEQGGQNVEETYLYLGHALLYQGDVTGATAAYTRALELNENFYPAEIALQSIG